MLTLIKINIDIKVKINIIEFITTFPHLNIFLSPGHPGQEPGLEGHDVHRHESGDPAELQAGRRPLGRAHPRQQPDDRRLRRVPRHDQQDQELRRHGRLAGPVRDALLQHRVGARERGGIVERFRFEHGQGVQAVGQ